MSFKLTQLNGFGGGVNVATPANVIDFKTGFDNADASSYTPSVTISTLTGSRKGIVAVCFGHDTGGANTITDATFNSVAGTQMASNDCFSTDSTALANMRVFYWLNANVPTGGSYTLDFSGGGAMDSGGYALFTIDNMAQTTPVVALGALPEAANSFGATYLIATCDADDGAAANITINHGAGITIDHTYNIAESGSKADFRVEMDLSGKTSADYDASGAGGSGGVTWYLFRIDTA